MYRRNNMIEANVENLMQIFAENKHRRICVLGTTCTGKSTFINATGMGLDMDEEIFPLLSDEEIEFVSRTPWTEEIGKKMNELVRSKLSIKPGTPLFGTVLLDCDLILYLHIDDELLKKRCASRGVEFINAKNMQQEIKAEIDASGIETMTLEIEEKRKNLIN